MLPEEVRDAIPPGETMNMLEICNALRASVASVAGALHEAMAKGIVRPVESRSLVGRYRRKEDDPVLIGIGGVLP